MSWEIVELVRAGFAAHNRGDLDALVEFYDPDVVFETLLLGTHRGNEAIRLIYEENQKTLSGYDVVPHPSSGLAVLGGIRFAPAPPPGSPGRSSAGIRRRRAIGGPSPATSPVSPPGSLCEPSP